MLHQHSIVAVTLRLGYELGRSDLGSPQPTPGSRPINKIPQLLQISDVDPPKNAKGLKELVIYLVLISLYTKAGCRRLHPTLLGESVRFATGVGVRGTSECAG